MGKRQPLFHGSCSCCGLHQLFLLTYCTHVTMGIVYCDWRFGNRDLVFKVFDDNPQSNCHCYSFLMNKNMLVSHSKCEGSLLTYLLLPMRQLK